MADIIDFELWKDNRDLSSIEGPCEQCRQQSFCVNTCERAAQFYNQWAKKFNKLHTLHQMGID